MLCGVIVLYTASTVHAEVPFIGDIYQYKAVNRDVLDVLRGFAADQRLNIVFDPSIPSFPISETVEMSPRMFLDHVTGKYGLIWYYDGATLSIYPNQNVQTQSFRLSHCTPDELIAAMRTLNAYSERFPYRVLPANNVVIVTGPQRLIDMTKLVISSLDAAPASSATTISVFPLKFASANDQTIDLQSGSVVIPGVATTLSNLVTGQSTGGPVVFRSPRNLPSLTGYGLDRFRNEALPTIRQKQFPPREATDAFPSEGNQIREPYRAESGNNNDDREAVSSSTGFEFQPNIQADSRLNAVIIQDVPQRMATYEHLIQTLDRPSNLIEITAKIIDISKEGVFEWGLPYDMQWSSGGQTQQISLNLTSTDTANLAVALVKDQTVAFMQQVKALEQDGHARVASRPSILTLDNVEAEISNSETFFVRVEGDFEVDLFDVSVGTTLNIIPRVIDQGEQRFINLSVHIDDGAIQEQTVDEIPAIRNDSITTQAVLQENQSLLIGGLFREEKSIIESRIPVLGRIPGIGFLFRTEEHHNRRVERFVLIEPRIVGQGANHAIHPFQLPPGSHPQCLPAPVEVLPAGPTTPITQHHTKTRNASPIGSDSHQGRSVSGSPATRLNMPPQTNRDQPRQESKYEEIAPREIHDRSSPSEPEPAKTLSTSGLMNRLAPFSFPWR